MSRASPEVEIRVSTKAGDRRSHEVMCPNPNLTTLIGRINFFPTGYFAVFFYLENPITIVTLIGRLKLVMRKLELVLSLPLNGVIHYELIPCGYDFTVPLSGMMPKIHLIEHLII